MVIDENWGIPVERARAFFRAQPEAAERSGRFFWGGCVITLTPDEDMLAGRWTIPRTQIRFEGPEKDVQAVHHRFFLQFLSAGG